MKNARKARKAKAKKAQATKQHQINRLRKKEAFYQYVHNDLESMKAHFPPAFKEKIDNLLEAVTRQMVGEPNTLIELYDEEGNIERSFIYGTFEDYKIKMMLDLPEYPIEPATDIPNTWLVMIPELNAPLARIWENYTINLKDEVHAIYKATIKGNPDNKHDESLAALIDELGLMLVDKSLNLDIKNRNN